ncbi:MAG: hydantoinase B/oxoprolinase family protein [Proteobacteria bacterium]|nr:hydantoinase B/oxoprolinase family protein [Pseudomonadota bacterium]
MKVNPILLEVFKNRFASIAEEMGMTLMRTGFSPNIKERRDFSCAVFNASGDTIAQAAHIPVHLGSLPLSVKAAIEAVAMDDGDMVILNDPFQGGTHLPDITLVAPVFSGQLVFYVANRAHHADVGGMAPGSMPLSGSIFQEGIIIPPLKLVQGGKINEALMRFILRNVRTPQEREADFAAQIMANITGVGRAKKLIVKYGPAKTVQYAHALIDYAEILTRSVIKEIPDGVYTFEDVLDDDGFERRSIPVKVRLTVKDTDVVVDFSGSGQQVQGSLNAVRAVTLSAVLYVFRSLVYEDIPTNAGCLKPIKVVTEKGTIVDAEFPAAVAGGNVETSQRIVDVVLGALAEALPDKIPAASQGTMNNVAIGGYDPHQDRPFVYYETLGGGMGASACGPGESAIHSHMTNTLNTPVEALEYAYPFLVTEYSVRRKTGGRGKNSGGDGLVREIQLLADAEVTVLSERRARGPYGLRGGKPGTPGKNIVFQNGRARKMPGKFHINLRRGDTLRLETPGGGGYGSPQK